MDSTDLPVQPMGDSVRGPVSRRALLMTAAALGLSGAVAFDGALPAYAAGAQLPFPSGTINPRNPYGNSQGYGPHRGIDFAVPAFVAGGARQAVIAAAPGRVVSIHRATDASATDDPYGSFVDLEHGADSAGHLWHTRYHMLWEGTLPGPGEIVQQGQTIGFVDDYHLHDNGNGGSNWRGEHLHFEVHSTDASIPAYIGTYYGVTRRCVDPEANIGRVPTNPVRNTPAPLPTNEENDMILLRATEALRDDLPAGYVALIGHGSLRHISVGSTVTALEKVGIPINNVTNAEFFAIANAYSVPRGGVTAGADYKRQTW